MALRTLLRPSLREPAALLQSLNILALIVAAGCVVFTLVDATLLEPLPFAEPDRLVQLEAQRGDAFARMAMRELQDLRERTEVFTDIAAYVPPSGGYTMSDGSGNPHQASAVLITHNLFSVLGVPLARGSSFPASYDLERSFGIVLNDRMFRRRFGSSDEVFDQVLTLDGAPNYQVFGVTPSGFDFPARSDLFRSIYINEFSPNLEDRGARRVVGVARLKQGVSVEMARERVANVGRDLEQEFPDTNAGISLRVRGLEEALMGDVRSYLLILGAAALLLVIIGTVNVSNLLLVRALGREREFAVRAAIGASRPRLAAQLLAESCLVALGGVALGLGLGYAGIAVLRGLVRFELPSWVTLSMDGSTVAFGLVAALVLGVAVGLLSALRLSGIDPNESLRGGRSGGESRSQRRLVRGLLVVQVAFALVLLASSASLVGSFARLSNQDFGFENEGLLSFKVNLPWFLYSRSEPEKVVSFHQQVLDGLAAIPGVDGVAMTTDLPLTEGAESHEQEVVLFGQSQADADNNPVLRRTSVSSGFFETLSIPLLEGRLFTEADRDDRTRVAVVNRAVAERFWPGESALGKRLRVNREESDWLEVVGVVDDVRRAAVGSQWRSGLQLYYPWRQELPMNVHYVARAVGTEATSLIRQAEQAVWHADAGQPVWDVETMDMRLEGEIWRERTVTWLAGLFAVAALLLATAGLYAALSQWVRQRRREFGLRVAVGADSRDIASLVLRETGQLLLGGLGLGLLLLLVVVPPLAERSVFLEAPTGLTLFGAALTLSLLVLLFSLPPVRRAQRVDPMVNLRAD